jgi:hypothetical protein
MTWTKKVNHLFNWIRIWCYLLRFHYFVFESLCVSNGRYRTYLLTYDLPVLSKGMVLYKDKEALNPVLVPIY